jgi:hypothetical protein
MSLRAIVVLLCFWRKRVGDLKVRQCRYLANDWPASDGRGIVVVGRAFAVALSRARELLVALCAAGLGTDRGRLAPVWCIDAVDGPGDPPARRASSGVSPGGERCEHGYVLVESACDYPRAGRGGERSTANVS